MNELPSVPPYRPFVEIGDFNEGETHSSVQRYKMFGDFRLVSGKTFSDAPIFADFFTDHYVGMAKFHPSPRQSPLDFLPTLRSAAFSAPPSMAHRCQARVCSTRHSPCSCHSAYAAALCALCRAAICLRVTFLFLPLPCFICSFVIGCPMFPKNISNLSLSLTLRVL